jgi:hypothetical protein
MSFLNLVNSAIIWLKLYLLNLKGWKIFNIWNHAWSFPYSYFEGCVDSIGLPCCTLLVCLHPGDQAPNSVCFVARRTLLCLLSFQLSTQPFQGGGGWSSYSMYTIAIYQLQCCHIAIVPLPVEHSPHGSIYHYNIGTYLPNYTALLPKRPWSWYSPA